MHILYLYSDLGLMFIRIAISASFLVHGFKKFPMWKKQPDENMSKKMINIFRILSVAEPLGGIALLFGFLAQWAALGLIIIMLGALYFKIFVWKKTFSENGGWEFDLVLLATLILIFLVGAGVYSLDYLFSI